jgi:hypothetical protein
MLRKPHRNLRKRVLYAAKHHIYTDRVRVEVLMLDDAVGVATYDKLTRRSWRHRIPLSLISAMIQVYYYDLVLLWSLLAKGVMFNGFDVELLTDHVKSFPMLISSALVDAAVIWQVCVRSNAFLKVGDTFFGVVDD